MNTILIIDDNKDLLDALSAALRCHLKDCGIVTALDGARGINIVESTPINLIVTDLAMPVMNGYLFIEYAKKHYSPIPICVMTGGYSPQIFERLQSLGIGRWIKKPFLLNEFIKMISEALRLEPQRGGKSAGIPPQ